MKRLVLILSLVAFAGIANATNYYVSAIGNDASAGTSPATAWKSIAKVNAFTFAANDSILFKRGEVFFGAIVVSRNNLNFSAYGTGARPVITGFVSMSSWTLVSTGIYQTSVNAKSNLNMVALNGRPQQLGRYPNASDVKSGYLTYEAATATTITDNEMTSTVDWTGAEIAIRKNGWTIERDIITAHSGTTFTYRMNRNINPGSTPVSNSAKLGHGYFIMDDIRTLDQFGEWYFDTTAKKISMYFGTNVPASYNVQVSVIDTLMNLSSKTYINVSNLSFEGGNSSGIFSYNGSFVTIQNCDFSNIGSRAVHIFSTSDVLVENVNTSNVLSNAIQVINRSKANVTVRGCVVRNTSQLAGMGSFFDDSDYKGIYVIVTSNALIENNVVDTVGLSGIQYNGNNVIVQKNFINYFCNRIHDNGGIYTYAGGTDASPGTYYTNRTVKNNIIMNGIGAPDGTDNPAPYMAGIYNDGRTMNVNVLDNTILNCARNGIHCNNPASINISGNTLYNNWRDISFTRWSWGSISNLNIKKNISFPLDPTQENIHYINSALNTPVVTTVQDNIRSLGSIDSNYFNTYTDAGIKCEIFDVDGGTLVQSSPYTLDGWRSVSNFDLKSKRPAQKILPYTLINTVGANLFTNSQFAANISGVTLYGTSTTASFDNTSKITGTGSLRMDFAAPAQGRYSFIHTGIGAVSSAKKYILRFKMLGTTVNGIVRTYIRKTASPYTILVPIQTKSFGMSKLTQEFLFDGPVTDAGGSFVIEIEQNSGTTYIDDIEFYEANATVNTVASQVRLEYNATNAVKTVSLDAKYIGVDSTVYNGTITLQPFTSQVLVKAGPIDSLPVANAGPDKVVYVPADSVLLNGTATGSVISGYTWAKVTGPTQFTITNAGTASTKVTGLVIGVYKFELKVTDNRGFVSRDTLMVTVSSVLPVSLLRFTAVKNNSKVDVKWVTTAEINSRDYVVERRINGGAFESIGRVVSNNVAERQSNYSLTDNNPGAGVNYYRLKMVDRSGSFAYSNIVSVDFRSYSQSFLLDNARLNNASLSLNISSNKQQLLCIIAVDAAGRVVLKQQVQLQPGSNSLLNDIKALNKGGYYIKLFTSEDSLERAILSE
jgi:hypothetical protein